MSLSLTPIFGDASVAASGTYDIKAPTGQVYSINNIYYGAGVTITRVTPAGSSVVHIDATGGIFTNTTFRVSDTHYFTITNTDLSAQVVSYDGIRLQ